MGPVRAVTRLVLLIAIYCLFGLIGLLIHLLFFYSEPLRSRSILFFTRAWARCSCFCFNIRVRVIGNTDILQGSLVISNHVGSPDIFIMGSRFPAYFVSKAEIGEWPLFNWLARLGATLFVDRSRRHQVKLTVEQISRRLLSGSSVILFPEGRASDGTGMLPFKTSHFEAAVLARCPVVPVVIKYHDAGTPSVACWWDKNFVQHIWALLENPRLEATAVILPMVSGETDRRSLAEKCFNLIQEKRRSL